MQSQVYRGDLRDFNLEIGNMGTRKIIFTFSLLAAHRGQPVLTTIHIGSIWVSFMLTFCSSQSIQFTFVSLISFHFFRFYIFLMCVHGKKEIYKSYRSNDYKQQSTHHERR